MELKRFYVSADNFKGNSVVIGGDEFYHMTKVLRHKVGYKIIVSNNADGKDYHCVISQINTKDAAAEIVEVVDNECKTKVNITLCQALPKGDKLDFIVQKSVELGVGKISVFNSDYVSESKFNLDRLNKINIEACKQCGRSRVAEINGLYTFKEMLTEVSGCDLVIFAYEKEHFNDIKSVIERKESLSSVAVVIGSEGGFSENEVALAKEYNAEIVTLGSRIMRCETASVICTGIVMYELGEMSR